MKRLFILAVLALVALAAPAVGNGVIQAESCDGHGSPGRGNNWCRQCYPPPPNCVMLECSKCYCDYSCGVEPSEPDARIVRLPPGTQLPR